MATATPLAERASSIRGLCPQRLLPVVVLHDTAQAEPLRAVLVTAGLPCAEITFRTAAAVEAITTMAQDPNFVVGAGTVLSPRQVEQARGAGARFVVSPGFSAAVAAECRALHLPYFPGVATPTEIQHALEEGFTELKFFPAGALGGPGALKAVAAPFAGASFIPTGGITATSLPDYLALPAVATVGGTWIASEALLQVGDLAEVGRRAAWAVRVVTDAFAPTSS